MIVEVETLTDKESEIQYLENKVSELMDKLELKELDPKIYQKMMDNLYPKTTDISKQKFSL